MNDGGQPDSLYDAPDVYYAACCSFRDVALPPAGVRRIASAYARGPVSRVLELCCGPAPCAESFVRMGFSYTGVDLHPAMLAFAASKYGHLPHGIRFERGDVLALSGASDTDVATILSGSFLAASDDEAELILHGAARRVRPGGLFILEACVQDLHTDPAERGAYSLTVEGCAYHVATRLDVVDAARQLVEYRIDVECGPPGGVARLRSVDRFRLFTPQELSALVGSLPWFEVVGAWDRWDLGQPLCDGGHAEWPVVALRRLEARA